MWDLIVSVPDHCLSFYFTLGKSKKCRKSPTEKKKKIGFFYFSYLLHI